MAFTSASERDYLLANGKHLRSLLEKQRERVKPFGGTDANLKKLDQAIHAVESSAPVDLSAAQRAYDLARDAQRNLYRLFHACARAVFEGIDGDGTTAGKALLAHAPFPDSDARLVAASKKVAAAQRKYAAKLAAAGFAKAEQDQFIESPAALEKAAVVLRKDKTTRSSAVQARADAIAKLRRCIKFLREAGKRAFRDLPEARDFAPVTRARKPKAKVGSAPVPVPAHAAANGAAAG